MIQFKQHKLEKLLLYGLKFQKYSKILLLLSQFYLGKHLNPKTCSKFMETNETLDNIN